jgi:hypothetical protein
MNISLYQRADHPAVFRGLLLLWLACILMALWWSSGRIVQTDQPQAQFLRPPPLVDLDTRLINILTLGHRGLFDDFMAIWILQILVDPKASQVPSEELQKVIKRVTRHNPRIESLYLLAGFVLGLDHRRPDLTESILRDGMRGLPGSWRIPLTMGFLAQNKLEDLPLATVYYSIAAQNPGSPPYIQSLATKLLQKQNLTPDDLHQTINSILSPEGDQSKPSRMQEVLKNPHASTPKSP